MNNKFVFCFSLQTPETEKHLADYFHHRLKFRKNSGELMTNLRGNVNDGRDRKSFFSMIELDRNF